MRSKLLVLLLLVCALPAQGQHSVFPAEAEVKANVRRTQRLRPAPAPAAAQAATGQTLPIRRVILYSNGVAYIERRGTVSGHAEVDLSFKQSQVDDVLKSMVVLDLGQGRIGAVSYNSSAPPSARLAEIPFSIAAQTGDGTRGGLAGVLAQLQGARVTVTTTKGTVTGSVLTIEERKSQLEEDKPAVTTDALVITTEAGELASLDLADVRSVKLIDEGTRKDVNEFANASASARRRDAKTITVTSDGVGSREMVVSYTIAAPIWKTTYRVVLDQAGVPFFQGWAIVDNISDEDWTDVKLSLVSGTPISFIQPIQQPFYRYRPVVPIPSDLKLDPQTYEPGVSGQTGDTGQNQVNSSDQQLSTIIDNKKIQNLPLLNRDPSALAQLSPGATARNNNFLVNGVDNNDIDVAGAVSGGNSGVDTAATGGEVGDLFEYRIDQPVTVRRDRSALIPIVQTKMEGERVSVYNQATRADRALGGMLLKNTSALTLEGGSMTILDGDAYAGEALMERLKPGEQRLISFALDLGTVITSKQNADRAPVYHIRASNGVFETFHYQTDQKTYTFKNQTDKPRVIYVEHPIRDGWELDKNGPTPAILTARYYRFRVELAPFEKKDLVVAERHSLSESIELSNVTEDQIEFFVKERYIDQATRDALQQMLDLRSKMASLDAKIASADAEIKEIGDDQARLRENIKALTQTAEARQLITRYVAKADEQESRIEQLTKDRQAAKSERARLEEQLAAAVRAFDINRDL